eukprot:scaffold207776_cov21-Prasinocladus_malaysianus.AAC.2
MHSCRKTISGRFDAHKDIHNGLYNNRSCCRRDIISIHQSGDLFDMVDGVIMGGAHSDDGGQSQFYACMASSS